VTWGLALVEDTMWCWA